MKNLCKVFCLMLAFGASGAMAGEGCNYGTQGKAKGDFETPPPASATGSSEQTKS